MGARLWLKCTVPPCWGGAGSRCGLHSCERAAEGQEACQLGAELPLPLLAPPAQDCLLGPVNSTACRPGNTSSIACSSPISSECSCLGGRGPVCPEKAGAAIASSKLEGWRAHSASLIDHLCSFPSRGINVWGGLHDGETMGSNRTPHGAQHSRHSSCAFH